MELPKKPKAKKEPCDYCGKLIAERDNLTCPQCDRPGCCTEDGGCMPGGKNCICPQCENGDEDGDEE